MSPRAEEKHLLERYLAGLAEAGAGSELPPFPEVYGAYRLLTVDQWIAIVLTLTAGGMQPNDRMEVTAVCDQYTDGPRRGVGPGCECVKGKLSPVFHEDLLGDLTVPGGARRERRQAPRDASWPIVATRTWSARVAVDTGGPRLILALFHHSLE